MVTCNCLKNVNHTFKSLLSEYVGPTLSLEHVVVACIYRTSRGFLSCETQSRLGL